MDINAAFQGFMNKDDSNQALDLDNIIRNIYTSCDTENTGTVWISRIINFIEPFLQGNVDALEELKLCFSAYDTNYAIDVESFQDKMKEWIDKISNANNTTDTEMQNIIPNMNLENTSGCFQYVHDFPKDQGETSILNLSTCSVDVHDSCIAERLTLETHIQELQYQKNQMKDEMTRLRYELSSCHEQNESLQGNLDKLYKKFTNEQKFNENLQMERKKHEELQDELSRTNKQIVKMEKTISSLEKQNNQLNQQVDHLQIEKKGLEQKIQGMEKKAKEANTNINILQSELDLRKLEVVSQHDGNITLLKQNEELQDVIEECNINIEKLKLEKETLEKLFREQIEKSETLATLNRDFVSLNNSLESNKNNEDYEESINLKTKDDNDQFYYNFHTILLNTSNTSNLRDELAKATTDNIDNNENDSPKCNVDTKLHMIELEEKLDNLRRELIHHENCAAIISRQNEEIEFISRENSSCKERLENLRDSYDDLKTQLSLNNDKECLLLEKCRNLEDDLKSNASYVAEIQTKLDQYTDLESKYKDVSQKIEELETDNSMKYIKIVNLTVEMEKLRQILAKTDQQNKEELAKNIKQLEKERKLHEEEKNQLLEKIKILNEQKVILQNEKEKLLNKIIQLEQQRRQLLSEKDELWNEQEQLKAENLTIKSKKNVIELEITRVQNEKASLLAEKDLLKSQYSHLELVKKELEKSMKSRVEILEERIESAEMENRSLLTEFCTIKRDNDQLLIDISEYKNERSFNLQLKNQLEELTIFLEKLQKEHELVTNEYESLKVETRNGKDRIIELTENNAKMTQEIITFENKNAELLNKKNSIETELLVFKEKTDYYIKKYDELDEINKNLICKNNELILKLEKNENGLKKMDIDNKQLGVDVVNLKLALNKSTDTSEMYVKFNENLSSENYKLQNSIKEYIEQSQKKDRIIHSLEEIQIAYQNRIKQLETNLESSKKKKEDLKKALVSKTELLSQIEEEMKRTITSNQIEKDNMKIYIEELKTKYEKNENLGRLTKTISDLEIRLGEEKLLAKRIKEELGNAIDENNKLEQRIMELEGRVAFTEKQNQILDKEKNNLKQVTEESDEKLVTTIKSKCKLSQKNNKLIEENDQLCKKCDKLAQEVAKKSELLDRANQRVNEVLSDLRKAERKISENECHKLEFLTNAINRNKEDNEKIKIENNDLLHEKKIIMEKLKVLEEKNLELSQQLEEFMLEKDAWLTDKIYTCRSVDNPIRSKPKTGFDRLLKKNMRLDDRIEILEDQLSTEKRKSLEISREISTAKERELQLVKDIENIKQELYTAIKNNDVLMKDTKVLIKNVNDLKEENHRLKENFHRPKSPKKTLDFTNIRGHEILHDKGKLFDEISELRHQLENEIENKNSTLVYIHTIQDRLCERRLRLSRATLHAINVWKPILDADFISAASKEGLQPEHLTRILDGPLDEEILQMEYQIQVTTLLLDKLTSIKNHDTLRRSEESLDFEDYAQREISPNITDVLENLDLSENIVRIHNISTTEMEEKFTALVLAYTIDTISLVQRCNKQGTLLRDKERTLKEEISVLSDHLENCAIDTDLSTHLEHILSLCTQISISAEQFGSLMQQQSMSAGVELMINYVARLRQNFENLSNQYLSIKEPPETICAKNEIQLVSENSYNDVDKENYQVPDRITKNAGFKETCFMVTLSIAVLVAVVLFNMFENCHTSFEYTVLTPPV